MFAPAGTYRINGTLTVPKQTTLKGSADYPFRDHGTATARAGTTLLAFAGQGNAGGTAFITLDGDDTGIAGVSVFYPEQDANRAQPYAYPPTKPSSSPAQLPSPSPSAHAGCPSSFGLALAQHASAQWTQLGWSASPVSLRQRSSACLHAR